MSSSSIWIRNLLSSLETRPVVILHGNVRDRYIQDGSQVYDNLTGLLGNIALRLSRERGLDFSEQIFYDPIGQERKAFAPQGASTRESMPQSRGTSGPNDERNSERSQTPDSVSSNDQPIPPTRFLARLARDLQRVDRSSFVTIFYLDKLIAYQTTYQGEDQTTLLWLEKVIENIAPNHRLVLVGLQDTMIPIELYTHSPKTRVLGIPLPNTQDRRSYLAFRVGRNLHACVGDERGEQYLELAALLTDGLYLRDLDNIALELLDHEKSPLQSDRDVKRLVDKYRLGEQDDHWARLNIPKLNGAHKWFTEQRGVKGQDEAIQRVTDILCMARAGLAGIASGTLAKPKGVLFFAGPSGVGKTFVAKKLAEFLFGTEEAFLRFDMSEFKEEHTVSKLLGSPPGYVGYEQGGMLTNEVRQRPFSVVLFDEIEKAHPKIMDIFLQTLDDGRLTDSRGQTVFFSETIIIFTSNLGTRTHDSRGNSISEREKLDNILGNSNLDSTKRRPAVREHFTRSVQAFFQHEISRPELLNRIGGNILPFNYIHDMDVQRAIVASHLERIQHDFADQHRAAGYGVSIDSAVADWLVQTHGQRMNEFGARGITHAIEDLLVPLSYAVLAAEYEAKHGVQFRLCLAKENGNPTVIRERS